LKKISWLIVFLFVVLAVCVAVYAGKNQPSSQNTKEKVYPQAKVITPNNKKPVNQTKTEVKQEPTKQEPNKAGTLISEPTTNITEPSEVLKNLPNEKCGWGLKRNKLHATPEVPVAIQQTLRKYDAYYLGNPFRKEIYLTFDEGYENGYTPKILDILRENNVPAAFFVTGHYLKSQPELVKRMVKEGHVVGNHSMNHPCFPDLTAEQIKEELEQVENEFNRLTGKNMIYLRSPKGEYSERTLAQTKALAYYNIFWSLAMKDWVPMPGGPEEAYQTVMDNLHHGAVVLLHAVSQDNTEALDRLIKDIKGQGYTFKTLDELIAGK